MKTIPAAVTLALAAAAFGTAQATGDSRDFEIRTLSSRANTVSGGDVLVEVSLPRYVRSRDVVVRLNGRDVSAQLSADASGRKLTGLVTGLALGKNRLTVSARHHHHHQHYESLEIVNHPSHGEIFAPHQRPWVCETEASGLGAPPASGPCVAATRYEWFYRNTAGALLPLPGTAIPADVAQTTTIDGQTVNFIVRVESGTINESIYQDRKSTRLNSSHRL